MPISNGSHLQRSTRDGALCFGTRCDSNAWGSYLQLDTLPPLEHFWLRYLIDALSAEALTYSSLEQIRGWFDGEMTGEQRSKQTAAADNMGAPPIMWHHTL
jgi:hypothetical protein